MKAQDDAEGEGKGKNDSTSWRRLRYASGCAKGVQMTLLPESSGYGINLGKKKRRRTKEMGGKTKRRRNDGQHRKRWDGRGRLGLRRTRMLPLMADDRLNQLKAGTGGGEAREVSRSGVVENIAVFKQTWGKFEKMSTV